MNATARSTRLKGKVKQAIGDITGNKDLKAEGKRDEASGKAQEAVGEIRHKAGDAISKLGAAVKK